MGIGILTDIFIFSLRASCASKMLYLEDYLEMIENLPMEMRERLTEMREMDLQVQNALDSLDEKVKGFFKKCQQTTMKTECKDESFKKIKEEYYKALEDADEKVQLANHIHDLVDRHLRKLDLELLKFKMELEADNAGITEVLEKRSLEMDSAPSSGSSLRSERKRTAHPPTTTNHSDHKRITTEKVLSNIANEAARETIGLNKKASSASNSPALSMFNSSTTSSQSSLGYGIGHIGSGTSNAAIAAAASQAIAATQQVMQQGRRTPSMKASYVAMTKSTQDLTKEFNFTKESPLVTSVPTTTPETSTKAQRKKQQTKSVVTAQQQPLPPPPPPSTIVQPTTPVTPQPSFDTPSEDISTELQIVDENGQPVDWQNDPNEPRYCLCNQVSYGEMVGCDNDDCPIEWFHYGCVGLTQAPKGKWFCPQCTAALKRRGRR